MVSEPGNETIREAVGVFFNAETLEAAMDELLSSGFDKAELGLVAGDFTVKQKLGHIYTEANEAADDPDAPRTAFVAKDSLGDTPRAWLGSALSIGAAVAGGLVVVSAGVLGGALALATAGGVAVGGMGAILARLIGQSDAEYLEEQVGEGHLLLFVRTRDAALEKRASEILSKHSAYDVRIYSVPAPATA